MNATVSSRDHRHRLLRRPLGPSLGAQIRLRSRPGKGNTALFWATERGVQPLRGRGRAVHRGPERSPPPLQSRKRSRPSRPHLRPNPKSTGYRGAWAESPSWAADCRCGSLAHPHVDLTGSIRRPWAAPAHVTGLWGPCHAMPCHATRQRPSPPSGRHWHRSRRAARRRSDGRSVL